MAACAGRRSEAARLDSGSGAASVVACGRPATWEDAIAGYLARRRRSPAAGHRRASRSFDADGIRHRLKVLTEVGQTLGAAIQKIDPDAEVTIRAHAADVARGHQLALPPATPLRLAREAPTGNRQAPRARSRRGGRSRPTWSATSFSGRQNSTNFCSSWRRSRARRASLVTATRTREQFVGNGILSGIRRGSWADQMSAAAQRVRAVPEMRCVRI